MYCDRKIIRLLGVFFYFTPPPPPPPPHSSELLSCTFTVANLNAVDNLLSLITSKINCSHHFTIINHREIKSDTNKQLFCLSFRHVYNISIQSIPVEPKTTKCCHTLTYNSVAMLIVHRPLSVSHSQQDRTRKGCLGCVFGWWDGGSFNSGLQT